MIALEVIVILSNRSMTLKLSLLPSLIDATIHKLLSALFDCAVVAVPMLNKRAILGSQWDRSDRS
jgi:hypothetical protein